MAPITQQINLYQVPQRYVNCRLLSWLIIAGVIATIFFGTGAAYWKLATLQTALVNKKSQLERLNATMVQQMAQQSASEDVLPLIDLVGKKIEQYEQLTQLLDSIVQTHADGYVAPFQLFSNQSSTGLWFVEIVVSKGGESMTLRGNSESAALVGQYLSQLKGAPLLSSIKFKTFNLKQLAGTHLPESTGRVSFTLSTDG